MYRTRKNNQTLTIHALIFNYMKKKLILASFLGLATVTGCLDSDFAESEVMLQVQDRVEVASDLVNWEPVTFSLGVTSNRSWSASLTTDAPWLTVLTPSRSNVGNVSESASLKLQFEDWGDPVNDRTATLHISTEGASKDVAVVQKALVPRFELVSPETYFGISEAGETFYLRIKSNWHWKVSLLADKTDAKVTLDCTEGFRDGTIAVTIGKNTDNYPKSAYLLLASDAVGPETYTVIFHQNHAQPLE